MSSCGEAMASVACDKRTAACGGAQRISSSFRAVAMAANGTSAGEDESATMCGGPYSERPTGSVLAWLTDGIRPVFSVHVHQDIEFLLLLGDYFVSFCAIMARSVVSGSLGALSPLFSGVRVGCRSGLALVAALKKLGEFVCITSIYSVDSLIPFLTEWGCGPSPVVASSFVVASLSRTS
ncbi:hypothetical protein Dimus_020505 [Dionaea muscipula]